MNETKDAGHDDESQSGFGMIGSGGGNVVNNFTDLGTLNEPCFFTTYTNGGGK